MALMGCDIGTTGTKAVVFDAAGQILAAAYREYPLKHPQPGWAQLDSRLVWSRVTEAIAEAAHSSRQPVEAIGLSAQGEAATPVNRQGQILDDAIVTFDNRTAEIGRRWTTLLARDEVFRLSGMPPSHIHTLSKIMWIKEHRPQVYAQTWKFLCFEELAAFFMTGRPVTDYSLAARTMAFDVTAKRWSARLLEAAGVDEALLPEVAPSGTLVGEIHPELVQQWKLAPGAKVVTGGHDQPAGALGAGITRARSAMDATGTVECVCGVLERPVFPKVMLDNNLCVYPHTAPDLYCTLAFNFTGGALLRWYRDQLAGQQVQAARQQGKDPYDLILEEMPEEPTGLLVLPHFTSTGTPYMDPHPTGAIVGLELATTRGQVVRALLEGITFEIKLNLAILAEAGVPIDELRAIGGGAKSRRWLQLKADVFNRPVTTCSTSEAACLGVALLAGTAVGTYNSVAEGVAAAVRGRETYLPHPARAARYEEIFRRYRKLYPALKTLES